MPYIRDIIGIDASHFKDLKVSIEHKVLLKSIEDHQRYSLQKMVVAAFTGRTLNNNQIILGIHQYLLLNSSFNYRISYNKYIWYSYLVIQKVQS